MTITMREVYQTITDALTGIDGLAPDRVFHGNVPDALPTFNNGQIMPYVVIWARVPVPTDDMAISGVQLRDGKAFPFQTTCVATDPLNQLMPMTDDVAAALTGLQIGSGNVYHESSLQSSQFLGGGEILPDPDLPDRYIAPMRWYLETQ
ncbi:hypothetical protein [Nesterenkonia jeotgali]|uniref:Uncharacterized protein n=1 Tax=Nesterenkonia jeotgali TaxID=317018 RepID=A0A0W8IG87_9MICC|nr:hypothetical protein [Nesterenkonia jeotgali]KUG58980.1 hypothetical protein AVL63_02865 [Nesterenkonia jeotgali]